MMVPVPEKPTSEQIRLEAEKLRDTEVSLIEHAATLIARAAELQKQVSGLKVRQSQPKQEAMTVGKGNCPRDRRKWRITPLWWQSTMHYNFAGIHKTLRITLAMAAGLRSRLVA
jgi:hypothetical protein